MQRIIRAVGKKYIKGISYHSFSFMLEIYMISQVSTLIELFKIWCSFYATQFAYIVHFFIMQHLSGEVCLCIIEFIKTISYGIHLSFRQIKPDTSRISTFKTLQI